MNWFSGIAGDVLAWVISGSAAAISGFVVNWLAKLAGKLKIDIKDSDRKRIQEFVENGIKWAAEKFKIVLDGNVSPADKTKLIAAVAGDYLPKNAAETVKALGGNVNNVADMTAVVTARAADVLALPAIDRALATVATEVVAAPVTLTHSSSNLIDRRRARRVVKGRTK